MLFLDGNGNGAIDEKRDYVFTEWDPTATSDMAALRSAFDTNGDGKLTSADAKWGQFKILVTNADGSTTAKTLSDLAITDINLLADATNITLPDGSHITGQALFTRSNGSTGIVADATLVAESDGHRVVQTTSTDASLTRTTTSTSYDAAGSVISKLTSVANATGTNISNTTDDNGDGVTDRLQSIITTTTNGIETETLINKQGNNAATAVTLNSTTTTTSADKKIVAIQRDSTGGGWSDQLEQRTKHGDGSTSTVISNLAADGSSISQSTESLSANRQTRTADSNIDGIAGLDTRVTESFTTSGTDRIHTLNTSNRDGILRFATREWLSADGRNKWLDSDLDGNGLFETQRVITMAVDAAGASTTNLLVKNQDGSLRSKTLTTQSADSLSKIIKNDGDGDGDYDTATTNATVISANGSRFTSTACGRGRHSDAPATMRRVTGREAATAFGVAA